MRPGEQRTGVAGSARLGSDRIERRGTARHVEVWQARFGEALSGGAWGGLIGPGSAGRDWMGSLLSGWVGTGMIGRGGLRQAGIVTE